MIVVCDMKTSHQLVRMDQLHKLLMLQVAAQIPIQMQLHILLHVVLREDCEETRTTPFLI